MLCYAVLLDGGFIKRKLGSASKPATAEDIIGFTTRLQNIPALVGHRLHRIYYYDAAPSSMTVDAVLGGEPLKLGETEAYARNTALQTKLARTDFYAVRLGELAVRGWLPKKNLQGVKGTSHELTASNIKPNVQQKGVDMRIGLDIAALTLKKIAHVVVLVAADADFIPAMKFARREGSQVILVTLGNAMNQQMADHADIVYTDVI